MGRKAWELFAFSPVISVTIKHVKGNGLVSGRPLSFLSSFRQAPFIHDSQLAIDLRPAPEGHRPFFRGFKGRQI